MYELIQAAPRTYYIQCPAKMGLWRLTDTDVVLIDSGNDKDAGRKVQKILDAQGWHGPEKRLPSPDGGHPAGGHHHGAPAGPLL